MRRAFLVCLLTVAWPWWASAAMLPPLSGNVSGQLLLQGMGKVPVLNWRVTAMTPDGAGNQFEIAATGDGVRLKLAVVLTGGTTDGRWQLTESEVDLARWWKPLTTKSGLTGLPGDLCLAGTAEVSGEGTIEGGQIRGEIRLRSWNVQANSAEQKWAVPILKLEAAVSIRGEEMTLRSAELWAAQADAMGLALKNLELKAIGDETGIVTVQVATVEMMGGRIALKPFAVNPAKPDISAVAELKGVNMAELATMLPETLSEAHGRLNGSVSFRWNEQTGLLPTSGALSLEPATPASLRLSAVPGFLTEHMPARITWLPAFFGSLSQRWSLENPSYDTLAQIELGKMPLVVERLRVALYPDGLGGAKSAVIEVDARPASGGIIEKVSFTVNVSGPLNEVLRLGTDERVKLKMGTNR